jgi:hypothetical protein
MWKWLFNPEKRAVLGFVGAGIAAVIGAAWTVYAHFHDQPPSPPSVCAQQGNAIGGSVSGSTITNNSTGSTLNNAGAKPCGN